MYIIPQILYMEQMQYLSFTKSFCISHAFSRSLLIKK